jgi:beta-galactosidase
LAEKVEALVSGGGTFVATCFSGVVDETDLAFENGYPGPLSKVLGIWVEEIDAMYEGQSNRIVYNDGSGEYSCNRLADLLHAESAQVLATYGDDFYEGTPVLTENSFGEGRAYYIASDPEDAFLDRFYGDLMQRHNLTPPFEAPAEVEIAVRYKDGQPIMFLLNHSPYPVTLQLDSRTYHDLLTDESLRAQVSLQGYGVRILVEG